MNESALLKLRVIVERAVRPVQAALDQKKKMREELLAHVTGAYEDELSQSVDESAALLQVENRFGDSKELAQRLQDSVPAWSRFYFSIEQLFQPRPGESLVQRARRFGLMMLSVSGSLSIGLVLLIFPLLGKTREMGFATSMVLFISITFAAMTVISTFLTNWCERVLFRTSDPNVVHMILPFLLSSLIPICVPLCVLTSTSLFHGGSWTLNSSIINGTVTAMLAAPLFYIGLAKALADEKRYREEWASLEVD